MAQQPLHRRPNKLLTSTRLLQLAILLNGLLAAVALIMYFQVYRDNLLWRADFTSFYTGWVMVADGQGSQLYDFELQQRYQAAILAGRSFKDGLLPYVNPPHTTLPFVPLGLLSRPTALLIWTLLQAGILIWVLRLLLKLSQSWSGLERAALVSAVLAAPPLLSTFTVGTFTLLIVLCYLKLFQTIKDQQEQQAGIWLVIATIKFQFMLLLGLWVLIIRRWRVIWGALIVGFGLALITTAVLGWQTWAAYLAVLRAHSGSFNQTGIVPATTYSFKGTLTLMLGGEQGSLINLLTYFGLAGASAVVIWLGWRAGRPDPPVLGLHFGLVALLNVLFAPHSNTHDSLLLIVPAWLFYHYLGDRQLARGVYSAFVLSWPWLFALGEALNTPSVPIRLPVILMSILLIMMLRAAWRESIRQRNSQSKNRAL